MLFNLNLKRRLLRLSQQESSVKISFTLAIYELNYEFCGASLYDCLGVLHRLACEQQAAIVWPIRSVIYYFPYRMGKTQFAQWPASNDIAWNRKLFWFENLIVSLSHREWDLKFLVRKDLSELTQTFTYETKEIWDVIACQLWHWQPANNQFHVELSHWSIGLHIINSARANLTAVRAASNWENLSVSWLESQPASARWWENKNLFSDNGVNNENENHNNLSALRF